MTVHCRKCGSAELAEKNVAFAALPITGWTIEDGVPSPAAFETSQVEVEWETVSDDTETYVCEECGWEMDAEALVVKND